MILRAAALAAALPAGPGRPLAERYLPDVLLHEGPMGLLWWQWVALPVLAVLTLAAGTLLGWATRWVLGRFAARTRASWDDALVQRAAKPIAVLWAIAVFTALHPLLGLGAGASATLERSLRTATYLVLFWAGFRSVDILFSAALAAPWASASPSVAAVLPKGRKISKFVLAALGLVAVLHELGFQVTSLVAGLGIGGIALALGAQKTVENLFASLTIGVDQIFRVGDFVRVEDFVATVESIGMRSTRFRTLDRTLITLPNARLTDMRTERFTVRDRMRLFANLGLVYGTTATQLRAVIADIEAALRAHPKIWPDAVVVRFNEFKDSSLNVEVMAWFQTADWDEFTSIRQELYLGFMEIVERAGTSFAFPTRTVHLVGASSADEGRKR